MAIGPCIHHYKNGSPSNLSAKRRIKGMGRRFRIWMMKHLGYDNPTSLQVSFPQKVSFTQSLLITLQAVLRQSLRLPRNEPTLKRPAALRRQRQRHAFFQVFDCAQLLRKDRSHVRKFLTSLQSTSGPEDLRRATAALLKPSKDRLTGGLDPVDRGQTPASLRREEFPHVLAKTLSPLAMGFQQRSCRRCSQRQLVRYILFNQKEFGLAVLKIE